MSRPAAPAVNAGRSSGFRTGTSSCRRSAVPDALCSLIDLYSIAIASLHKRIVNYTNDERVLRRCVATWGVAPLGRVGVQTRRRRRCIRPKSATGKPQTSGAGPDGYRENGMDLSIPAVGSRGGVGSPGATASMCQMGRARSSQANRGVREEGWLIALPPPTEHRSVIQRLRVGHGRAAFLARKASRYGGRSSDGR